MTIQHHTLLILGSGPAGLTAAIYAARANLNPVIITGIQQGGQLTETTTVDNWPGEADGVLGPKLMQNMQKQAERFGTQVLNDHIKAANLKQHPFILQGDSVSYSCDALIIATGASAQYLGLESEQKYIGKGVSACATCDGFFYRNKKVAVIGGGNTALEEAFYLAHIAKEVIIVHRRDQFRAEKILAQKAKELTKTGNLILELDHVLTEVLGDNTGVTGIKVKNVKTNTSKDIDVDGVFIAIGHKPNSDTFIGQLDMHDGYINITTGLNGNATATNIPGIFAAGDITDQIYQQAVTAAAQGCMAALDAEKYLDKLHL